MKKILAFLVLAAVCCHAQTAPSAELIVTEGIVAFHDKTTVQFDMKDHAKSKGASMKMRLPKNWTASEGDRPNVVQKFTSPSKNEMVTIVTRKLVPEDGVSVEEAVKELFTEEALKQCAPEGAKVFRAKPTKVDGEPAGLIEYTWLADRVGVTIAARGLVLVMVRGDVMIQVQCFVRGHGDQEAEVKRKMELYKPLFQLMLNSIFFEDKWTKP